MRLPRITKMPDNGFLLPSLAIYAAAGSTQATATPVTSQIAVVTGADGTKGVVLPSGLKGYRVKVVNSGTATLKVYPATGDSAAINAGAADAAYLLGPGADVEFVYTSKTQVYIGNSTQSLQPPAGTATVAPIQLAAGTNLTTAAAGAIEFDGTAFYATAVASSRQQVDAEQYTIASADSATYNNTGLDTNAAAPVFTATMGGSANGAVTLVAGKTYLFEAQYILTNTGTTSHTWAVLFGGTATFTSILYSIFGLSATGSAPATGGLTGYATVATAVVATAASTSATENVTIQMTGTLVVNAGGTLIPQMQASARPGASGTPGVVVKKGSFFRLWEMAPVAALGNWS